MAAELKPGFRAEAARIAAEMRAELGLERHDRLDPLALAEHLCIPVVPLEELDAQGAVRRLAVDDPDAFSAATVARGTSRAIVVNTAHSAARRASSLAHELAHVLLEHRLTDVLQERDGEQEAEADWLAGELLVPREGALAAARAGIPLAYVAARFGVSIDMARWRINATGAARQASLERWRRRVSPPREGARLVPTLAALVMRAPSEVWLAMLEAWDRSVAIGLDGDALADRVAGPLAAWAGAGERAEPASPLARWALRRVAAEDPAVRSVSTLRSVFGDADAKTAAAELEAHRIGIEPDPRHDSREFARAKRVALFRVPDGSINPTPRFRAARALVQLAGSGGGFDATAAGWLARLDEAERARLRAAVAIARRSKGMGRLTGLLDVASSLEPATLMPAAPRSGFAIPPPVPVVRLDPDVLRARLEETAAVESILAPIFASEEPIPAASAALDEAHASLLRRLAARERWSRAEIEATASALGLPVGGALEAINDAAFEACGEPACEGDDPVHVDASVVARLL